VLGRVLLRQFLEPPAFVFSVLVGGFLLLCSSNLFTSSLVLLMKIGVRIGTCIGTMTEQSKAVEIELSLERVELPMRKISRKYFTFKCLGAADFKRGTRQGKADDIVLAVSLRFFQHSKQCGGESFRVDGRSGRSCGRRRNHHWSEARGFRLAILHQVIEGSFCSISLV